MSSPADETRVDDATPNETELSDSEMDSVAGGDLVELIVEGCQKLDDAWQLTKKAFGF